MNSADGPQYSLTQAIVEKRTFRIDDFLRWTYNTNFVLVNDHYYSDKEIGSSILAVPFYILGKIVQPLSYLPYNGNHEGVDKDIGLSALTNMTFAVTGALVAVVYYFFCLELGIKPGSALISAITLALGTLMWRYSSGFYRHGPFLLFLLISYFYLLKYVRIKRDSLFYYSCFHLGLAVLMDNTLGFPLLLFYLCFIFWIHHFRQIKKIFSGLFFCFVALSPLFIYNIALFGKPFANPHAYQGRLRWQNDIAGMFKTPLSPALFVNLYSDKPVPKNAISSYVWDNEKLAFETGAYWATVIPYRGIFATTPLLFVSLFGFLYLLKKSLSFGLFILGTGGIILLLMTKYTLFWDVNTYDTRMILPAVPFFLFGLPFALERFMRIKWRILQFILGGGIFILFCRSLYWGWYYNLTMFAPNITGENRFDLSSLTKPYFTLKNVSMLLFNTFPNIFNLHLVLEIYFPLFIAVFVLGRRINGLLNWLKKYDRIGQALRLFKNWTA